MGNNVICRVCKQNINKTLEKEGVDWIMPKTNCYYHVKCYNKLKKLNHAEDYDLNDPIWFEGLKEYLITGPQIEIDYQKLTSQWNHFREAGRTAKGLFLTALYVYEVRKLKPTKAAGGIGILNYVYEESAEYWMKRIKMEKNILSDIQQQLVSKSEQRTIVIQQIINNDRPKQEFDWSDIDAMEDEDEEC